MPEKIKYEIYSQTTKTEKHSKSVEKSFDIGTKNIIGNKSKINYGALNTTLETINNISLSRNSKSSKEVSSEIKNQISSENIKVVTKNELLWKLKEILSELFNELYEIKNKHIILYLDDFYLINTENQPYILQYLHDVYKNCYNSSFCFKVCSLPYRLKTNEDGQVDFSYKDDYSQIKLDNNLSQLEAQKDYLLKILCSIDKELKIGVTDIENLFSNGEVLLYSVIATGGIPRDFLIMFAELIREARADNSNNIVKKHVYSVIKSLKQDKNKNLEYDSEIDIDIIKNARNILEQEVIGELETNVILYPSKLAKRDDLLLKNLVNLRYLHKIKDSTSSVNKKNEEFVPYLVDMIFYATKKRMPANFHFRKFWEKDERYRLRELDTAPIWNFPPLEDIIQNKGSNVV